MSLEVNVLKELLQIHFEAQSVEVSFTCLDHLNSILPTIPDIYIYIYIYIYTNFFHIYIYILVVGRYRR